jgi:hypothetical protein
VGSQQTLDIVIKTVKFDSLEIKKTELYLQLNEKRIAYAIEFNFSIIFLFTIIL